MRRPALWLVAVVAVLLVGVTTAVAVSAAGDGDLWTSIRDGMMSSQRDDRPHRGNGQQPGWLGTGPMMFGAMHGMRAISEEAYLVEMVAHHKEAVGAAQQLRRSPRAEMREFADAISASQSAQMDQMRQWLADWYPDQSEKVNYRPMMRDLTDLSGQRLDRVFLEDMIWHHMAAVMMSRQLLSRGLSEHDEIVGLAETIRDEQHAEIVQMQQWLRDWFGVDWRHSVRGGGWNGMHGMGAPWMTR